MSVLTVAKAEAGMKSTDFVILVGGLENSEESQQFIDFVTAKYPTRPHQGPRSGPRAVVPSLKFLCNCSWAYFLKLPSPCDEVLIDGRMLADIAIAIENIEKEDEVSIFFYLVNDSQELRIQAHRLQLQLWGRIFQAPPEPGAAKFLIASSIPDASLADLRLIWQEHISGPRAVVLSSHEQAEASVRETIGLSPQMAVQFRTELLQSIPLRKTTVGRHYVGLLEGHIKTLESAQNVGWKLWKKLKNPDGSLRELKTELRHWKKCKLPQSCKGCPLIE